MEAAITLAMAGIIATAAASAMSLVMRTVSKTRTGLMVQTHLINAIQFLSKDIENSGGNGLPAPVGILVEDSTNCPARDGFPACNGSDRVTVVKAIADLPVCVVMPGAPDPGPDLVSELDDTPAALNIASFQYSLGGCCFPSQISGTAITGDAVLTSAEGGFFRVVRVTGNVSTACEFTLTNVLPNHLGLNAATAALSAAVDDDDFQMFHKGTVTLVEMNTYFLDTAAHELRVRRGGESAPGSLVAEHIYDFQISLGYDMALSAMPTDIKWVNRGALVAEEINVAEYALATTDVLTTVDPLFTRTTPPREVMVSVVQGVPSLVGPDKVISPLRHTSRTITAPGMALRAGVAHLTPTNSVLRDQ